MGPPLRDSAGISPDFAGSYDKATRYTRVPDVPSQVRARFEPQRERIRYVPMAPDFSTEVAQAGDETIIHVRGDIDIACCERLRDAIEPHLGPHQTIVLDLSKVEFMDSSCLRVLLQARGTLTADGGSLVLRNPSDTARRLLTAARAEDLLQADADEQPRADSN